MQGINLAKKIARLAHAKNARDVIILDLRGLTGTADFFVVCHGDVDLHVRAVVEFVSRELRRGKVRPLHRESTASAHWITLDYVDVIFHCFLPEARRYYNLEGLWADALTLPLDSETGKILSLREARSRRRVEQEEK
jgi:ribosome-associated protein